MPEKSEPENQSEKRKVLDLIDPAPRPSRRERQRIEAAKHPTIEDAKKEALNLFDEDEKKNRGIHKTERSGKAAKRTTIRN